MSPSPDPSTVSSGALGRRLGSALFLIGILIVFLGGLAVVNLTVVRLDARKTAEETRESALADSLLATLQQIQMPAPTKPRGRKRQIELVERSRQLLSSMAAGPRQGLDPSTQVHQDAESSIVAELRSTLDALETLSTEDESTANADAVLLRAIALGESIRDETDMEAARATEDLNSRIEVLIVVTVTATAVCLVLLFLLLYFVHTSVVQPLRSLQEGTRYFGRGDLDHRIEITSDDEIGDLAREFNMMAERLSRSHSELEARVEERTRQFIRAAKLADLGAFAAGVAHEVNTPLASIASCAEGLMRRLDTNRIDQREQIEYLQTIASEAYRAHEIADSLLAFARAEPGPVEALEIEDSLREVARLLQHEMEKRRVTLEVDIESGLPHLQANPAELKQVVLNLLKNALDASPRDGIVFLRCCLRGAEIHTEVQDQGAGVPRTDMQHIFDPFYTTKPPGKGTGLGLALARSIVEGYGGRLEVSNSAAGGAIFTIVLPTLTASVSPNRQEVV